MIEDVYWIILSTSISKFEFMTMMYCTKSYRITSYIKLEHDNIAKKYNFEIRKNLDDLI